MSAIFFGFTDGSWKILQNGSICSGIGGVLLNLNRNVIFSFSGQVKARNPLIAEREALLFLYTNFKSSPFKDRSLSLHTDSLVLNKVICQVKVELSYEDWEASNDQWSRFVKDGSAKISYIARDDLKGAHELEKKKGEP